MQQSQTEARATQFFAPYLRAETGLLDLDKPETAVTSDAILPDAAGRLLALDLGLKRVGIAVSDELRITANPLPPIDRRSWKDLLGRVAAIVQSYDARGLVIGLPLSLDGTEGSAAADARAVAEKFQRSLRIPVYLQDERLTTVTATARLKEAGRSPRQIKRQVDSESASLILGDFIADGAPGHSLDQK
jgi:putative Holliday junction resolvase